MHLNAALPNVPQSEREEFLREIRAHIFETLERPGHKIPEVLKALCSPEELARQFLAECLLEREPAACASDAHRGLQIPHI